MRIRPARPADHGRLRRIAAAAKGHWGHDPERVRAWVEELDFAPPADSRVEVFVAELDGRPVAWAALIPGDPAVLDDLWVEPAAMRQGIGTALFRHVADRARALGATRVEWDSEPEAVGFYERVGGRHTGRSEPSSWGRLLPRMAFDLA